MANQWLARFHFSAVNTIWALTRQALSSGFPTKRDSNKSPQLQRLARNLKYARNKHRCGTFYSANNKCADHTARMRSLVCAFVVRKPQKTGFLVTRPISPSLTLPNIYSLSLDGQRAGYFTLCPYFRVAVSALFLFLEVPCVGL